MTIVQQPDSLSFCGNLKDFIITGESELSFSLYSGSTILIAETYTAYNNKIIIPCKKVIEQQFTICLPDTDVFVQTRGVLDFNAHIGDTTVSFRVIKGGIGDAAEVSTVFLKSQFLTLQPQQKQTLTWQPEFLNYYTQEQCRLKLRAYFADGTNEEKYIADMETGKLYTIDLSFLKVNGKFEKQVGYYDAWIENTAGNRLTYIQRYILTHPKDNSQIYVFENTLGGLDSVCFTGLFSEKLEINGNITTINDESSDSDIDFSVIYEQNTGYIPTFEYIRWLRGFFLSCQRYHVTDSFRKIYIEESENTFRLTELNSYIFEFCYSLQSKYDFVTRNQEMLPELLEFPAGDELFFLAPRLSEFPIAAIADDLVLPAQFSFENQWRRISIAAIIQAAISASIDATLDNIDLTDYWKKEELVRDELYLKFLDKKISSGYADKAGNSEKWNNKQMSELLDQPVRKTDSVQFKKITTDEIISDNFVSGPLGEGMNLIRRDSSGKSYLEIDKIFARYKAVFAALEIRKLTYAGGNYIFSPAGATCTMVEDKEGFYRCYFTADDGEKAVENLFRTDDFVQCRESNIKSGTYENISNRYYWRRCIATGDDYIDLSKSDCDTDSDIPAIGDSMVTIGNKTVSARQNAIIISVYGEGSPSFIQYKGINSFSLEGKAKIIISPDQNRFTGKFTFETGEDAEESIKNISESAKEQGIIGGKEAIDNLQIGSQNLISKKMMLKWNEKNKDIAVWGQDADGVYLDIAHNLLYNIMGGDQKDIFDGSIRFKANTQYIFSVEWKVNITSASNGIYFIVYYTDGSKHDITLSGSQTTKKRVDYITEPNKTIDRISSSYGTAAIKTLLYNISLIEGNKPLQGFPVAEEDQTGANNVNLADGTKGPFTIEGIDNQYAYRNLYIPTIKPNTVYYVNVGKIEILSGNVSKCDFILFDKSIKSRLTTTYHHLYDKNGGVLITKNDFEAQEGYLLCYAGEAGATAGNSVRFTEVMLVEGFLPAPVWTPSFTEQQAGIDAANSTATAAQNAVMQVTKSLTELTAENGQIKASVKEVSQKVDTVKTDAEEFTLNNKGNGNNVATAITESFRIDGGYHILKLGVGKAGDIFTLSVETTKLVSAGSQAGKQMLIYTATSTASTYVLGRINATSSVKQIITFTLPQNMKDDVMICATEAWSGTNDVTKLKLEYGNKTTDWTPSTEDQNAITNKAKQEAIVTAASDATTKANNAKQQAITSAAADATNKADKAKQDAITSAAADATTKADTARNAAKSYTDDRTEPLWKGWIDASALDQTKYYPVVFYCEPGRRSTIRLEVALNSGVKPGWSTHASGFSVRCVWSVNGGGWGKTPINRIIDDFAYSFANVIPAGDVGQMTNSSREYIYVRGGGKYYFVATNTGTPFLVTSDYTASNQTISVKTSVTTPAITNATKTEVSSEIKVVKGLIEQKVAKTDYDKNNQVLNQSIGNLQTSYNSISGTVSSLNTRLQTVEKAGFITTSQGNTLYAGKKLENGNELISYINQDATTFAVKASKIKLEGLVTANGNVQITTEGKIIAVNAEITGKITAGSGKIGGFNIYTDYIENNRFKLSDDMILFKNGTSKVVVGVNHKSLSGTSYQPLLYLFTPSLASNESCAYMECNGNILELCKRTEVINAKGTVTINGAVYFKNVTQAPSSNYYLCIDRSTGRLYYR